MLRVFRQYINALCRSNFYADLAYKCRHNRFARRWNKLIIGGLLFYVVGIAYADTKILGVTEIQSLNLTVATKDNNFTVEGDKTVYLVDASASAVTVTLLSVTSKDVKNRTYHIKKTDSSTNNVTVDADGSQTIDSALTAVLENQFESINIISDGVSNWGIH